MNPETNIHPKSLFFIDSKSLQRNINYETTATKVRDDEILGIYKTSKIELYLDKLVIFLAVVVPITLSYLLTTKYFDLNPLFSSDFSLSKINLTLPRIDHRALLPSKNNSNNVNSVTQNTIKEKSSVFQPMLNPLYADPVNLKIADNLIDINLHEVSVDSTGQLETPDKWNEGGWYKHSVRPGEVGNIIINAHYDSNTGAPAAFWELKKVQSGDKVYLKDELGKIYTYHVTETFYLNVDDPDRLKIFDTFDDKSHLTLITCGGVYISGEGYNQRLVVKADLVK